MSEEKLYHCLHDECKFTKKGKRGKYTVRTDSGLRKHHQLVHLHPCCSGDKKCKTGATIRKWKIRKTIEKKSYVCKHTDCIEMLTSPSSRSNHQQREHFCKNGCQLCMRNEFREPNGIRAYVTEFSSSSPPFNNSCYKSNEISISNSILNGGCAKSMRRPILSPLRDVCRSIEQQQPTTLSPPSPTHIEIGSRTQLPFSLYSTVTVSTLDTIIRCLPGASLNQQSFLCELRDSVKDDNDANRLHSITSYDQARTLMIDNSPKTNTSPAGFHGFKLPAISSLLKQADSLVQ